MITKVVSVGFVVAVVLLCSTSGAEVVPLTTYIDCRRSCGEGGASWHSCNESCDTRADACIQCCHIKLPSATREHCGASCTANLSAFVCQKPK